MVTSAYARLFPTPPQHLETLVNERCPRAEPTDEWALDLEQHRYFVTDEAPTRQTLARLLDIIMENNRAARPA